MFDKFIKEINTQKYNYKTDKKIEIFWKILMFAFNSKN